MLLIFGLPLLMAVTVIKDWYRWADTFPEYFFLTLGGLFILAVVGLVGLGIAALLGLAMPVKWNSPSATNLVTLRDKDGVKGSFFLGTGTIESTTYYFYYRTNKDGSYSPGKVAMSESVKVYEEEREDAVMKTYEKTFANSISWALGFVDSTKYEFYIPKGTIKKVFSL